MSARVRLAAMCLVGLASCDARTLPPEGQFVLHVTTDAPLPPGPDATAESSVPLFDRLSIEVLPAGATAPCRECTREFEVSAPMVDHGRASIGIVTAGDVGRARVRVRLFRGGLDAPAPRAHSSLEQVIVLPPAPSEGVEHLTVVLRTDDVGRAVGTLDAPVEATRGEPSPGLVGTWWGARRAPCGDQSKADEACIPGGPYWIGDPRLDMTGVVDVQGAAERLVVLSPFHLDQTEVTVGAFRASGLEERTQGGVVFNPQPAGASGFCTYREAPGAYDTLPVNCLTWRLAKAYCEKQGKRLPTEAELAYAASGLGTSSYVWGEDPPSCDDAVYDRNEEGSACAAWGLGPAASGRGARDRLALEGAPVLELAGNLMEFAADFWQLDKEPCWNGAGVLHDPLCDEPSASDKIARSVRGGDFTDPPVFLRAAVRTYIEGESKAVSDRVGFRCARSASR